MDASPANETAARAALHRVLASDAFANTGRMSRLLRFVVERTLEGRAGEIKEYVLGTEVFDRGPDYDPRLDSIVRVEVRRLRAKLDEYYVGPGADDPIRIRIRRGTYVPEFVERAAAPAAPAAATAHPAAAASASAVDPAGDDRPTRRRSALWIGATLAALALAAIAAQVAGSRGPTSAASDAPRLAVLPLAPDSAGDAGRARAARLTDGITAALVRIDHLAIVASASAARFDHEPRDVRQVAQALDADWLVEGSVFVEGDRVRVAARLVDPSRDRKVWAEDFDGEMAGLRDLERRIAEGVDQAARSRRRE